MSLPKLTQLIALIRLIIISILLLQSLKSSGLTITESREILDILDTIPQQELLS